MANKWRNLTENIQVQMDRQGPSAARYVEDDTEGTKARKSIREKTDGRGLRGSDLMMTASYPTSVKIEMHEALGDDKRDPQARMWYIANKAPECLLADAKHVPGCPPRGKKSFRILWPPLKE